MQENKRPVIECECMDRNALTNIKLALMSSRNTFKDMAVKAEKDRRPDLVSTFDKKSNEMHAILMEIGKIRPCST